MEEISPSYFINSTPIGSVYYENFHLGQKKVVHFIECPLFDCPASLTLNSPVQSVHCSPYRGVKFTPCLHKEISTLKKRRKRIYLILVIYRSLYNFNAREKNIFSFSFFKFQDQTHAQKKLTIIIAFFPRSICAKWFCHHFFIGLSFLSLLQSFILCHNIWSTWSPF